jgi:hypothetical protein
MIPSTTTEVRQPNQLWRAEETFWQRYSPHHEFPLATVSAVTLCGMALGVLILLWLVNFGLNPEFEGPPGSDAVAVLPGGGGPGMDDEGTSTAPLAKAKTELAPSDVPSKPTAPRPAAPTDPLVKDFKANPLTVPGEQEASLDTRPFEKLEKDANQADLERRIQAERAAAQKAKRESAKTGSGGPPGGKNGPGAGGGTGTGVGPGNGSGTGPNGGGTRGWRAPTVQEIHARRWRITLAPDIDLHLRTLIAMRVTYIFVDNGGRLHQVLDLKRTPVETKAIPPIDPTRVVAWQFEDQRILPGLALKLGLRFRPKMGLITLPADVEQNLAAVEQEAMLKQGRPEGTIRQTHFGVRFNNANGTYEPYVTGFD